MKTCKVAFICFLFHVPYLECERPERLWGATFSYSLKCHRQNAWYSSINWTPLLQISLRGRLTFSNQKNDSLKVTKLTYYAICRKVMCRKKWTVIIFLHLLKKSFDYKGKWAYPILFLMCFSFSWCLFLYTLVFSFSLSSSVERLAEWSRRGELLAVHPIIILHTRFLFSRLL